MEYTNIDASFNGLICKKVDVIDPENDNIIEMQKIKLKDDKNNMAAFISIISISILILSLIYIIYLLFQNNKNSQGIRIRVFLYIIALLALIIFLLLSLIGAFNS